MADLTDDMMERSTQQGMNCLVDIQNADIFIQKEAIFAVRTASNGFNTVAAVNAEAKSLEAAINRGVDHSETSYRFALSQVFQQAAVGFHAQTAYDAAAGVRHPVTALDTDIPATATRIVFRF